MVYKVSMIVFLLAFCASYFFGITELIAAIAAGVAGIALIVNA